ncbi:hypothetical protein ABZ921_13045 [Streptomyces atriruber]|uniref:Uncharacterized protein n=1 Tax=Streptomyces atriruber TaxID=545121 RepID=A0ABV3BMK3_9ACTN
MAYSEMVEHIRELSPEGAALFAAGCAYRVSPIVDACATERTANGFRDVLGLVLQGAGGQVGDALLESLQTAPELDAESAEELHYWANHALALLFESVAAMDSTEAIERAEACCALALNIAGDLDAVMSDDEGGPETELPPAGLHERLEIAAQSGAIALLAGGASGAQAVDGIRELSHDAVSRAAEVMPAFVRSLAEQ